MIVYAEATEASLIHQALQGDRNAFAELVRRNYPEVLQVVYRMCGDMHLAEDAVQEAFIRAWLDLATYRPVAPLRNWLYRIAINLVWDTLRRERHRESQETTSRRSRGHPFAATSLPGCSRPARIRAPFLSRDC
jgi:RNA polymerase sigma factor (sigma-70 family)